MCESENQLSVFLVVVVSERITGKHRKQRSRYLNIPDYCMNDIHVFRDFSRILRGTNHL